MAKYVKKPHLQEDTFRKQVEKAKELDNRDRDVFMVSFRQFDHTQGQTFEDWEQKGLLSQALHTLRNYSHRPLREQFSKRFKPYQSFPESENTIFKYPEHVTEEAEWASMHVQGKECMIGHIFKNTFFLVFLDCDHDFWISDKADN